MALDRIVLALVVGRVPPDEEPAPAAATAPVVEAAVDQDAVEPRGKLGLPREGPRRLVEADEGVLGAVLGILAVPHDGPGDAIGALLVPLDQEVEGSRLAIRHTSAQRLIGWLHRLVPARSSHTLIRGTKVRTEGNAPSLAVRTG
jgi:hypothetical protein